MKKIIATLLCALMLMSVCACAPKAEDAKTAAGRAKAWLDERIATDSIFSFNYNGEEYSSFISGWDKEVSDSTTDAGLPLKTVKYTSPEGVIARAEITFDEEFAALDWCCYFENGGASDSPVISEIRAMDASVEVADAVLTTANGSEPTEADFEPIVFDLAKNGKYDMGSSGGRSSQGAFPYFDITGGGSGVVGAIGWTGQWTAFFECEGAVISISAGMKTTSISLHAGEDMRTPSMLLIFFDGDSDAGHNQLRRLILKSYTPSDETGKPVTHLPLILNDWGGIGEQVAMQRLNYVERIGYDDFETFWLDAGWYGDKQSTGTYDDVWYSQVGNWYYYEGSYPNGFTPISDRLKEDGRKLLVWFEPERAMPGTKIVTEHPDYFLAQGDSGNFLLYNLASDEAADYLIDLISDLISDNGIGWYRQDFNCDPYEKWLGGDALEGKNRQGITEIKYITNLYRYLDSLIERNPGLLIDNCASGGKRLDIEMMKRSFPLWRTDYTVTGENNSSFCDGVRNINYNLTSWLPLSVGGRGRDGLTSVYRWRCTQGSGMVFGTDQLSANWMSEYIDQYKRCRELMTGDYYILAAGRGNNFTSENAVYEFFKPETGEGYLMVFRPSGSAVETQTSQLKGLDASAPYLLENADTGDQLTLSGEQLMSDGLEISISMASGSALIFITRQ